MNKQVTEQPQSLALKDKSPISGKTVYPILIAISISHLLNDALQSIIPAIYPVVKNTFSLSFAQVGLITLTFQLSASILQPFVVCIPTENLNLIHLQSGWDSRLSDLYFYPVRQVLKS
jgi:FSR family fosmidomycin resistance protein-like MFS transporter